jgi:hypothetical protein
MNTKIYDEIIGKTINEIVFTGEVYNQKIHFLIDNEEYVMYHDQDCCESVSVDEIIGDVNDLIGSTLTMAEEVTNPEGVDKKDEYDESFTWTFYKFATIKGYVTIKWYGESNGYYSESVDFEKSYDNFFKKRNMDKLQNKI